MAGMKVSRKGVDTIIRWWERPQDFVREVFEVEPDAWQEDVLAAFPTTPRIALQACKGPGKTTTLSWIAWNFLATRPRPNVAATSITGDNLQDGLWKEMAKWQAKSPMLKARFEWQKTRIVAKEAPEDWFMSARTWPRKADAQAQADSLAGFHADYTLFLIDESGSIPLAVGVAADAAMATGIECHIVQAGNPTDPNGMLGRASKRRDLWKVFEITGDPDDAKRASRVDIKWARDTIAEWGRDNPYTLINIFGRFPPGGLHQLISEEEVEVAMRRHYRELDYNRSAKLLGVDVAREGDDSSIVFPRQGLVAFQPMQFRHVSSLDGAGAVARKWDEWEADACFVDATGGYGWGWIDQLRSLGKAPIPVQYAGMAHDKLRYANKRAEMAFDCAKWVKEGGALPNIPELARAMSETTYGFKAGAFIIEPKEEIKARLGFSPDHMDALMETFAEPVSPRIRNVPGGNRHQYEWEPFQAMQQEPGFERPY